MYLVLPKMSPRKKATKPDDLVVFTLRLDKGLMEEIQDISTQMDLNASQWCRRALIAYLKICMRAVANKQANGNTQAYSLDQESSAMLDLLIQKGLV